MNLISKEGNIYEFLIETLDDLWILSQFIVPNDKIFGTTERKIKIGSETNYKIVKKIIYVELIANSIKFENEVLRITGPIQNETEFTAIGASHSLKYNLGDKIKIQKLNILKFEEKLIKNAIESKNSHNLLVLFDKDELVLSEFTGISFNVLFYEKGLGSKKYSNEEVNEEEQKYLIIENYLKKNYNNIIFAGPGIYKDKLQKYVQDKIGIKILTFSYPEVSSMAISKLIKKISDGGILGDLQLSQENKYITELLKNINLNSKFAYGEENTINSINEGSIEVLLISTNLIEKKKDEGKYVTLNENMKLVEQLNGNLVIIDSKNETGRILDGLGGIAGILRY